MVARLLAPVPFSADHANGLSKIENDRPRFQRTRTRHSLVMCICAGMWGDFCLQL